ncbi:MAG: lysozyme, partial [Frankiales bacterium]|nr:lysozyme [Frankiales bacterium]
EGAYYVNPYYAGDIKGARNAHLVVGSYAFARPALPISTAVDQARYFAAALGNVRTAGTLPPILDLEVTGGLGPADLLTWTQQFLESLRAATGRTPIVYSYPSFWSSAMAATPALGRYPLWAAGYSTTAPQPFAGWKAWTLWQYTSTARTPGIAGGADMSRFSGTATQLAALANGVPSTTWTITAPAAPRQASATAGNRQAVVRWLPSDDGGQLPSRYTVTASPGGAKVVVSGTTTHATVTGLTAGRSYTFQVTATNTVGTSPASAPTAPVTPGQPPAAPLTPTATSSSGKVALSWPQPLGAPTRYAVYRCTPGPCTPSGAALATTTATSYTDRAVANGSRYSYALRAANSFGASALSGAVTVRPVGPPSPPTALRTAVTASRATVSWAPPANAGGAAVTGYVVAADGVRHALPATARTFTLTGLLSGTSHSFAVAAVTSLGTGPAALARATTTSTAPTLTAVLSAATTRVGQPVTLTGATSPRFAGERLYRQGYYSGAWHTWATTAVDSTGHYRFVITPTVAALNRYRVVLLATPAHPRATSPERDLRVV